MSKDGDVSLDMQAYRQLQKSRKEKAREDNLRRLEESGVFYRNLTSHCVRIHTKYIDADFWPSSGKWHIFKQNKRGQGLKNLLRILEGCE